jgi:hypothetical protein
MTIRILVAMALVSCVLAASACGPRYVRGSEDPTIDEYAMSTRLDKADLEQLFDECTTSLMSAAVMDFWRRSPEPPSVAIFPIANETSEHIESQLQALLSKVETSLVNSGVAQVISREQQDMLIKEVEKQQGGAFDPAHAALYGRQLGARFFITGKAYDSAERTGSERRNQYFLFMQVVDVETGAIRWQHEAQVTKALVK